MKEAFIPGPPTPTPEAPIVWQVQAELTPEAPRGYAVGVPRLNRVGDIFMPEMSGEGLPPPVSHKEHPTVDVILQDMEATLSAQGILMPTDVRGIVKKVLEEGYRPEMGRPEAKLPPLPGEREYEAYASVPYSHPKLRNIAHAVQKISADGRADSEYLNRQIEKAEHLLDENQVPHDEALELLSELQGLRMAASKREGRRTPEAAMGQFSMDADGPESAEGEALYVRAKETFPILAAPVQQLRELSQLAATGKITQDQFVERANAIRADLRDIEKVYYKPPEGMPEEKQYEMSSKFEEMKGDLSHEIGRMHRQYFARPAELRQEDREAQLRAEAERIVTPLREAYARLDELVKKSPEQRTPDENTAYEKAYKDIEKVIEGIDFAEASGISGMIFEAITQESLADGRGMLNCQQNPITPESRVGKEHYGYALEYAVERIIGQGDVNPTADYPQFSFYMNNNLDELIQGSRKYSEGYWTYLLNLRGKRQLLHDLFKNLKDRQTLVGIVSKALDPGSMRFIEEQVAGTNDTQALFEKEYGRVAARNSVDGKGWIFFEQFRDEIDVNVEDMVKNNKVGLTRQALRWEQNRKTKRWEAEPVTGQLRKMRDWELSRAFNMGRALTGAMLRRQVYSAYGDASPDIPELVTSIEGGEEINMILAPLARIAARYFGQVGATIFLEEYKKRMVATGGGRGAEMKYSLVRKNADGTMGKFGLYGASEDATVLLDTGSVDMKSSWWRANRILRQKEWGFVDAQGEIVSIDGYLSGKTTAHRKHLEHGEDFRELNDPQASLQTRLELKHHLSHHTTEHFHHDQEIKHVLSQQRLFLGIIARRPDLSVEQKKIVWENVAKLLPSRIASLMPQYSMDEVARVFGGTRNDEVVKKRWDRIQAKLFIIEHARVQEDIRGLRIDPVTKQMTDPSVRGRDLMYYVNQYKNRTDLAEDDKITDQEIAVIQAWQSLGTEMSDQLAHIVWPHTPFLDDVPQSGFKHWGRNEFDRLLINDHKDWFEGYMPIVGLIANPATAHPEKADEEVAGILHTFVEKATAPESLQDAQRRVEGFAHAWTEMAKKFTSAKLTYDLGSWIRKPTSKMEMFNLSSGISYDEERVAKFLMRLGKMEVLSDDPFEKNEKGQTQMWRLLKDHNADTKARFIMYVRFMLLLFPLEFVQALVGGIIPSEFTKG